MTTKLCAHVYDAITIVIATSHVRNQWQPTSDNDCVLAYCSTVEGNILVTIDPCLLSFLPHPYDYVAILNLQDFDLLV